MCMVCAAFLSLSAAEEPIMTGILNPKMIKKQLELCAIGLCVVTCCHQQKCLLYALMCAAGDDSDYYCLQDEQLDAVSRFLVISYAEPFSPVLGELPKEENLYKIMLHFFFLDEDHPCAAVNGVRRRHQWQDRLWTQTDFVLRGQNISVEGLTMFLPRGGNVNCLLFLLTVSCIQVETCMSSENTINVSCDIVCKSAACFCFVHLCWKCCAVVIRYRDCTSHGLFPSKPGSHVKHLDLVWLWFVFFTFLHLWWNI